MHFIEIIGLGGSGKTTIANKLNLINKNKNLNFIFPGQTKKRKIYLNATKLLFKILIKNPLFLLNLFKSSSQMWLFKKIVYRHSGKYLLKEKKLNILVDSGCYEPFLSHAMFFHSFKNFKNYYDYFSILEKPLAVICLDIDPITAFNRFVLREKNLNKLDHYDVDSLKNNFISADRFYSEFKQILKNNQIKKIIVDANIHPFSSSQINMIESELNKLSESVRDCEI